MDRLARTLRDHEQEAVRLEQLIDDAGEWRRRQAAADATESGSAESPAGEAPSSPEASGAAEPQSDHSNRDGAQPPSVL
jgi:hypothetical protein